MVPTEDDGAMAAASAEPAVVGEAKVAIPVAPDVAKDAVETAAIAPSVDDVDVVAASAVPAEVGGAKVAAAVIPAVEEDAAVAPLPGFPGWSTARVATRGNGAGSKSSRLIGEDTGVPGGATTTAASSCCAGASVNASSSQGGPGLATSFRSSTSAKWMQ